MKIVIDISKDRYDEIMAMDWKNCRRFFDEEIRAIHDGKAIEQEPCNDCISRQDAVNACRNGWGYDDETIEHIVGNILGLPPVTPAEKVGRWEYVQYDGNPNIGNWHCSECRYIVNYEPTYNWEKKPYHKFCPMCGAKMEEVENEMHIIDKSPTGAEGSDKE